MSQNPTVPTTASALALAIGAALLLPNSLALLNATDLYESPWSPEVVAVMNRHFGTVFVMPFGCQVGEAVRHFTGDVVLRAYGLPRRPCLRAAR